MHCPEADNFHPNIDGDLYHFLNQQCSRLKFEQFTRTLPPQRSIASKTPPILLFYAIAASGGSETISK
jgi:hypothetical protein